MRLSVLTLNLLHGGAVNPAGDWRARLPLVVELLGRGADLIGLQEATPSQIADLERALSDYTVIAGPESGETRLPRLIRPGRGEMRRGEHCAILYRTERFEAVDGDAFWLSHQPHEPGSVLPGTWLPRVVNWVRLKERGSDQTVTFFNAHLDFMPWAPFRSTRILRRVLDSHWENEPQILVGDFNTVGKSRAYRHLCDEMKHGFHPPLADAWQEAEVRDGPEGTYHGGTGRVRWTGRLDRILYRPHLRVARVETITHSDRGVFPSDHFPVRADFEEAHG